MNNDRWFEIRTSQDAKALDVTFGGFHDSCLREVHLWTGHSVDKNLSMSVTGDLDNHARFLFQRQLADPSAVEMEFQELCQLNIWPTSDNNDSIIESAVISFSSSGNIQLLIDMSSDSPIDNLRAETRVIAKRALWRPVEWMGPIMRYRRDDDA